MHYNSHLSCVNGVRDAAPIPSSIHVRARPLVQPCDLISARSTRVDDHFFTVELARPCDGLLARKHALDREQLLCRHAVPRSPVTAHREGGDAGDEGRGEVGGREAEKWRSA